MCIVNEQLSLVLVLQFNNLWQRSQIARHSVDAIDADQFWLVQRTLFQLVFQIVQIVVAEPTGFAFAQPSTIVQTTVCIGINEHAFFSTDHTSDGP